MKLQQRRLYQQVAEDLGRRIQSGEFADARSLPAETQLAAGYGVSRNVMREALVALEIMGIVSVRAGAGAFVNDAPGRVDLSLASLSQSTGPGPLATLEARRIIEGEVAFAAAVSATDAEIAELTRLLDAFDAGPPDEMASDFPARFHIGLAASTHNAILVAIVESLWQAVQSPIFSVLRARMSAPTAASRIQTRRRIIDCVAHRAPEQARAAMHNHIDMVRKDLFP